MSNGPLYSNFYLFLNFYCAGQAQSSNKIYVLIVIANKLRKYLFISSFFYFVKKSVIKFEIVVEKLKMYWKL